MTPNFKPHKHDSASTASINLDDHVPERHSMPYTYKSAAFTPLLQRNEKHDEAARQFTNFLNREGSEGWEYVNTATLPVMHQAGKLSLKSDEVTLAQLVVFRKPE